MYLSLFLCLIVFNKPNKYMDQLKHDTNPSTGNSPKKYMVLISYLSCLQAILQPRINSVHYSL